ncbi:hypothetical protein FRC12_016606 [Ceratobasidium sp. 428]|nr:hypothetical protein FRC12_016606 [Ceratobasidium sp. 428]
MQTKFSSAARQIFGDLKAQNVLIGPDGVAKLTDFGLSILEKSQILFSTTSTVGGGSIRWMAPELIESLTDRTSAADVYALAMTFVEIFTDRVPFYQLTDDVKVMYAVLYKRATPDQPKRLQVGSLLHREWWLLLSRCWSRQPETRPKAADWKLITSALTTTRAQQLSKQLAFALCYGRTESGPLKNLDTNEQLPPGITSAAFFVFERVTEGSSHETHIQSKEASLKALINLYASTTNNTRRPNLDAAYVNNLQDLIYNGLEERIQQVRHWITINVAQFPPNNQDIRDLFAGLDAMACEMRAAARICSAKCSGCASLLCLRVYGHVNGEHECQPYDTPNPTLQFVPPTSSNLYKYLAAEDTTHCIRVQDLGPTLMGPQLPSRDAIVLGIEWQRGWYLPHESLVLLVWENRRCIYTQGVWWVRLARFLSHDFITPHRTAASVQRPRFVVRADMVSAGRLTFGHVLHVIRSFHQIANHNSDIEMDSWFYAATVFQLLCSQEPNKFVPGWWNEENQLIPWLIYQGHPTANHVQRERFQQILGQIEQFLQSEELDFYVQAPELSDPGSQSSAVFRNSESPSWEILKPQLDSGSRTRKLLFTF